MATTRPQLFCLAGSLRGATVSPKGDRITLGSAAQCDVRLPSVQSCPVAPCHAQLERRGEQWFVLCVGEGHEVFLNEESVREAALEENDLIRLGAAGPILRFRLADSDRISKTFQQMVVDASSAGSLRSTRGARTATFTRQLIHEAMANGHRWVKWALLGLGLVVFVLGALLVRSMLESKDRATRYEDERSRSEERFAKSEKERERLAQLIQEEFLSRQAMVGKLEALVERETAVDESLRSLANQTRVVSDRLESVRNAADVAKSIHRDFHRGVGFIYIGISFYNPRARQFVRLAVDPITGGPPESGPTVTLGGTGEKLVQWVSGSGFLVSDDGLVLTNRHVLDPWHEDEEFGGGLLQQGFQAVRHECAIAFPGRATLIPLDRVAAHPTMDLALGRLREVDPSLPVLRLAEPSEIPAIGSTTVLLGYPEGLKGIINKLPTGDAKDALTQAGSDRHLGLVRAIAERNGIWPTLTQGVLSVRNDEQLVYDAVTFSGGSGGPLFSDKGSVLGVNTAISRQFTGANYATNIAIAQILLNLPDLSAPRVELPEVLAEAAQEDETALTDDVLLPLRDGR